MPGPRGASVADIIALLREGHSNREIGRRLHTNPLRIGRIRAQLAIPNYQPTPALTLEQTWTTFTRPTRDGHLKWTGYHRERTCPVLKYRGQDYTARKVAFHIANGREPEGRVLAGCGWPPCVKPAHMEDAVMRNQYAAIFGGAA